MKPQGPEAPPASRSKGSASKTKREIVGFLQGQDRIPRHLNARMLASLLPELHAEVFMLDAESLQVVFASHGFCRNLGYARTEILQLTAARIDSDSLFPVCCRLRDAGNGEHRDARSAEGNFLRKNGTRYPVEFFAEYLGDCASPVIFVLAIDCALRSRIEQSRLGHDESFFHAQKMDALGTFAAGVAHNLNNLLMPIFHSLDAAVKNAPSDHPIVEDLRLAMRMAESTRDFVQQIRCFCGDVGSVEESVNLPQIVDAVVENYSGPNFSNLKFVLNLDRKCPSLYGNAKRLQEVVDQLCLNAVRAVSTHKCVIEISLKSILLDAQSLRGHPALREGMYALLIVKDRALGMSEVASRRIFEPFFSTTTSGGRRGLGLAMAHGIVQGHGGEITFANDPDEGMTFYVYLPVERFVPKKQETPKHDGALVAEHRAVEILFVDDDAVIVTVVERILTQFGYRVHAAQSGTEALAQIQNHPGRYSLLMTDYSMPEMTGVELARAVEEIHPTLPIIVLSGYHEEILPENSRCLGIRKFVTKPVLAETLGAAVRDVLAESAGPVA